MEFTKSAILSIGRSKISRFEDAGVGTVRPGSNILTSVSRRRSDFMLTLDFLLKVGRLFTYSWASFAAQLFGTATAILHCCGGVGFGAEYASIATSS